MTVGGDHGERDLSPKSLLDPGAEKLRDLRGRGLKLCRVVARYVRPREVHGLDAVASLGIRLEETDRDAVGFDAVASLRENRAVLDDGRAGPLPGGPPSYREARDPG